MYLPKLAFVAYCGFNMVQNILYAKCIKFLPLVEKLRNSYTMASWFIGFVGESE